MNEIWKKVVKYENYYEVSNKGNIRSLDRIVNCKGNKTRLHKGKILKLNKVNFDYYQAQLFINKKLTPKYIHQLVAIAFIENPNNYKQVNHLDGDKSNNNIDNLEWCSQSQNMKHSYKSGLHKSRKGIPLNK